VTMVAHEKFLSCVEPQSRKEKLHGRPDLLANKSPPVRVNGVSGTGIHLAVSPSWDRSPLDR
jgi:hypothetical protein